MYTASKHSLSKYHPLRHRPSSRIHRQYVYSKRSNQSRSSSVECHYATLGLVRNANEKDIRSAYISMAKQFHPDVNTSTDSTQKFSSINQAYSVLSDKSKKQQYDSMIGNIGNTASSHPRTGREGGGDSATRNWWDFNFYGNTNSKPSSPGNQSRSAQEHTHSDFEFGQNLRDFYSDFSRFSGSASSGPSGNTKKRKRSGSENGNRRSEHNPYSDYYYYHQQLHEDERRGNQSKYENVWSDFEFTFDVEEHFDSEFDNEAFWRFLRSNNKKHRATANQPKSGATANNAKSPRNEQSKQRLREKLKSKEKERSTKRSGPKVNGKSDGAKSSNPGVHGKSQRKSNDKETANPQTNQGQSEPKTPRSGSGKHAVSEHDIEIDLELGFLSAANGCTENIAFERHEMCCHCGGTTFEPSVGSTRCFKCEGRGCFSTSSTFKHFRFCLTTCFCLPFISMDISFATMF